MANDTFSLYFNTRPSGSTPVGLTDTILVYQNGAVVQLPVSTITSPSSTPIDASGGPRTQLLPASGTVGYIKDDNSANAISFDVSIVGQTINYGTPPTLTVQGERVRFQLIGTNWYIIG